MLRRGRRRQAAPGRPPALVLVADDDDVVREVLQAALEAHGHAVVAVADGAHALQAAREHRPRVAVLDWLMPGMAGPQVCEALRADPQTAALPVVLLTSQAQERDVVHAYRVGADEYVTKPFHPREVLAVVERLLAGRPELAEPPDRRGG